VRRHCHGPAPRRAAWKRSAIGLALAFAAFASALVVLPSPARAIPAFARRYETSCQTCHLVFPKLNPFGEAFRRNGYRFPSKGDAVAEKEEPLPLGNEAMKDVWPNAVYPGQLPGKLPISLAADLRGVLGTHMEPHNAGAPPGAVMEGMAMPTDTGTLQSDFDQLGANARILGGGTFGDVANFFVAISIGQHEPIEVERAAVTFTPFDPTVLQIKLGRFEPELHGISIHRNVFGHMLRLTTMGVLLDEAAPEHYVSGLQLSGVVAGRLGWSAGIGQNRAPVPGLEKDVFARLEYKFGGMRLDGVGTTAGSMAWREHSLTIGASGYHGRGQVTYEMPGMEMSHVDRFNRVGLDAHAVIKDLLVDVVVAHQRNDQPGELERDPRNLDLVFAEVTYMTWPWLFPSYRFEGSRVTGPVKEDTTSKWIGLLGINGLVRPNLVLRAELATGTDPGEKFGFRFAALNCAFAF
jgi:hypothetical protein